MQQEQHGGGWVKYPGNPVFGGKETGTCFDVHVHRREAGGYRMYCSWRPRRSLAFVESTDGIHWGAITEILRADPDSGWEDDINRSCVVCRDGRFYQWYTGQARGCSRIGLAYSRDGIHYTRAQAMPVMIPEYPWEKESVMNPYVLWDEQRRLFRMWYAAGETYEPNVICYAESPDGMHWAKSPLNPIFVHGDAAHECNRVGGCEVYPSKEHGFLMFYIGYENLDNACICAAASPDGVTRWRRLPGNPVVTRGGRGEWDADACYKPSVIHDEASGRRLLWYNGRRGDEEYIGLATGP